MDYCTDFCETEPNNSINHIMSKTLILEISDEVFSSFQKQAESRGETAEKFVSGIILKNLPKTNGSLSEQERARALEELMKFAGAGNKF